MITLLFFLLLAVLEPPMVVQQTCVLVVKLFGFCVNILRSSLARVSSACVQHKPHCPVLCTSMHGRRKVSLRYACSLKRLLEVLHVQEAPPHGRRKRCCPSQGEVKRQNICPDGTSSNTDTLGSNTHACGNKTGSMERGTGESLHACAISKIFSVQSSFVCSPVVSG